MRAQKRTEVFCTLWDFGGSAPSNAWKPTPTPPPPNLVRWQTSSITAVACGGGEVEGEWHEPHWDTSCSLYVASKSNCDGAARHASLNCLVSAATASVYMYIHRHTRGVLSTRVKKTGRVLCIHLNIQFWKNRLPAGVHNLILFSFSAECRNIKHIIPAFDHVTHRWYHTQCNRYILLQCVQQWAGVD